MPTMPVHPDTLQLFGLHQYDGCVWGWPQTAQSPESSFALATHEQSVPSAMAQPQLLCLSIEHGQACWDTSRGSGSPSQALPLCPLHTYCSGSAEVSHGAAAVPRTFLATSRR